MNSPNYFLADLPPDASVSSQMISEACLTLKRNRSEHLAYRTTEKMVQLLSDVSADWMDDDFPFRKRALERGPGELGFSREIIAKGITQFFREITPENLKALLVQDLGHVRRLDGFVATPEEGRKHMMSMARGAELMGHITAGNVPNAALMQMVLGLLLRGAQFVKCATGATLLPTLFAHSIYERDPKAASCLEIASWPGGTLPLEDALFANADLLTVTGSDEALRAIRPRVPEHVRIVEYGHKASFAFVARESLTRFALKGLIPEIIEDVIAWDQLGCLSPHVVYIENGGNHTAEHCAELLAKELETKEAREPRGRIGVELAAVIKSKRDFYATRLALAPDHDTSAEESTRIWQSKDSTAWTVVYESELQFQLSCLHRFIYVKPAPDLSSVLRRAENFRGKISTVALSAPHERYTPLATELAHWGVTRVCPIGTMQKPPILWRHDGRPALAELVTWTNLELPRT